MNKTFFLIFFPLFILHTSYFLFHAAPAAAQHFSSPSYVIDWGNFNITSGKKFSTTYSLTDTAGQIAPGLYTATGYTLKSGFQYIYDTINQFSFSITNPPTNNLTIALGTLVPGVASTATNIITVTTPSGHGYQIMAHENHPLALMSGTTIPDTACNIGSTCTISSSNVWTNSTDYGFGFNAVGINSSGVATGVGTSNYFADVTYFRPFADYSVVPPVANQIFMSENKPVKNHSARISYKALIRSAQAAGNYQNAIIFTAVPYY